MWQNDYEGKDNEQREEEDWDDGDEATNTMRMM